MADQTDFIALYSELGIEPDSSIDGLRLAYRRRVAGLHPDRGDDGGEDALKSLNQRYAAVLEFHRHHGRLPGASPAASVPRRQHPAGRDPVEPMSRAEDVVRREPEQEPEMRRPSRIVVYGIMLVTALLVWWLSRTDAPLPGFLESVVKNKRETVSPAAISLREGMHMRDVVSLLGDPVTREQGGTHWQYGPSWVRFECTEVIDWYSSPLRPLKASRSRPPGSASAASAGARHCPPVVGTSTGRW